MAGARPLLGVVMGLLCGGLARCASTAGAEEANAPMPRLVLAFYYPWYGTPEGPGGNGRTAHWGRIDRDRHDLSASLHYPSLGPYDSHDPNVIAQHCQWAAAAGVDGFIVSWWGHGSYEDRAMPRILEACQERGLKACVYYEQTPKENTPEAAARDIAELLQKYGSHPAHLKVGTRPVVFIYGRAVGQLGLWGWHKALAIVRSMVPGGMVAIGDDLSFGATRVFDGIHTYNTVQYLQGRTPAQVDDWALHAYPEWIRLAAQAGKISTLTMIPGYDDTKVRTPGLKVERRNGMLYKVQGKDVRLTSPDWVLITSFNEWHEGSEIEPSLQCGRTYLTLTREFAGGFKSDPPEGRSLPLATDLDQAQRLLQQRLHSLRIAALPDPQSMAFWWLLGLKPDLEVLSWQEIAAGALERNRYDMVLYSGGERYTRAVVSEGDVDKGLAAYLTHGGCLAVLPSEPMPFYYDQEGRRVNTGSQFGLTLRVSWEKPDRSDLRFVQPDLRLPSLDKSVQFPSSGDLRWRPSVSEGHRKGYLPLLQLMDGQGHAYGDGLVILDRDGGGRVAYAWFGLLQGETGEHLLQDLFAMLIGKR